MRALSLSFFLSPSSHPPPPPRWDHFLLQHNPTRFFLSNWRALRFSFRLLDGRFPTSLGYIISSSSSSSARVASRPHSSENREAEASKRGSVVKTSFGGEQLENETLHAGATRRPLFRNHTSLHHTKSKPAPAPTSCTTRGIAAASRPPLRQATWPHRRRHRPTQHIRTRTRCRWSLASRPRRRLQLRGARKGTSRSRRGRRDTCTTSRWGRRRARMVCRCRAEAEEQRLLSL